MVLEELRQVHGVKRVEDLTAQAKALKHRADFKRVGSSCRSLKAARGGEKDLKEGRGKAVEAILEVNTEGVVVEDVAEAGEKGSRRGEEGVGRGDVPRGEGGAE